MNESVDTQIKDLEDPEKYVDFRKWAAERLGKSGDPRAVEPLCRALLKDVSADVTYCVAIALGRIGDARAIEPLRQALLSGHSFAKDRVAEALVEIGKKLLMAGDARGGELLCQGLKSNWSGGRQAAEALGNSADPRFGEELYNALENTLQEFEVVRHSHCTTYKPTSEIREIAEALGKMGEPRAIGRLIRMRGDPNSELGHAADSALKIMRTHMDARFVAPLCELLLHDDKATRDFAGELLLEIGPASAEALCRALAENKHMEIRQFAAAAVGRKSLGNAAIEPLIKALSDKDPTVRKNAAASLGILADARAVEPLISTLKDKDSQVRKHAVVALGSIKEPSTIAPLITAFKDRDVQVRWAVVDAFKTLQAVEPLISGLNDRDKEVRRRAARALGILKDAHAVESLCKMLRDPIEDVREAALAALISIEDPRAAESLVEFMRSDNSDSRLQASRLLEKFLEKSASSLSPHALRAILQLDISFTYDTWQLGGAGSPDRRTEHFYTSDWIKKLARQELSQRPAAEIPAAAELIANKDRKWWRFWR